MTMTEVGGAKANQGQGDDVMDQSRVRQTLRTSVVLEHARQLALAM
jgi:hypothetical protein